MSSRLRVIVNPDLMSLEKAIDAYRGNCVDEIDPRERHVQALNETN